MDTSEKSEGKRFSRRNYQVTTNQDGEFWTERLDRDDCWSNSTVERHRDIARKVLESEGIDVQSLLVDSPHGSAIRDCVLNSKNHDRDSQAGLAAMIFEICCHILAYQAMEGGAKMVPGLAYRLGRLTSLAKTYGVDSEDHRQRRQDKPASDPYDSERNNRIRDFYKKWVDGNGEHGALTATGNQFCLGPKQVGRIVKKTKRT